MADDVTPYILEAMDEARNLLYCDDAQLILEELVDGVPTTIQTLDCGWSLIPPQAASQDAVPWVLRLDPSKVTAAIVNRIRSATVNGVRYEREWRNALREISSVWILQVRPTGDA